MSREMRIEVLDAKGLAPKSPNGLSNPFCIVGLADATGTKFADRNACTVSKVCDQVNIAWWKLIILYTAKILDS